MCKGRQPAIARQIFQPKDIRLIAGAANHQHVGPGLQIAARIYHQRHAIAAMPPEPAHDAFFKGPRRLL